MAFSKGQIPGKGHSPSGAFGHGGHHKINPVGNGVDQEDHMKADNGHMANTATAGPM